MAQSNFAHGPSGYYNTGVLSGQTLPGTLTVGNVNLACPAGVHLDGSNYLFCDGHVKWLPGGNVSPGWPALTSSSAPVASYGGNNGLAAGTANSNYAATFSPI